MTGEAAYYENGAAAFDQAFILGLPPRIVWYQFRPYLAYMRVGRYQDMLDLAAVTLSTQGGRNVEETYLYKGHALAFLGNTPGAIEAYKEAIRLNKYFYPAQWALNSISGNN
jgi:tetratricopeptide (TPR) repeat protein